MIDGHKIKIVMAINIITRSLSPRKQEVEISNDLISFRRHALVECEWPIISVSHINHGNVRERIELSFPFDKTSERWNLAMGIIHAVGVNGEISKISAEDLFEHILSVLKQEAYLSSADEFYLADS